MSEARRGSRPVNEVKARSEGRTRPEKPAQQQPGAQPLREIRHDAHSAQGRSATTTTAAPLLHRSIITMAKVLLAYTTKHGQTARIVERIAAVLHREGHAATLLDLRRPPPTLDLAAFDVACVGSPMYLGRYVGAVERFVRRHREWLERVPSAFFSVNLAIASRTSDGRAETLARVDEFVARTGWRPARVELFAGSLLYTRYGWLTRWMMRRIAKSEGGETDTTRDHEYTDWERVDAFAAELASLVAPASHSPSAQAADYASAS